ncbi:hypothetical protein GLAREA_08017 [Glarea lozoyensis ATCC 20868]|uniref:DUF6594 domain-containing protein n=1 Tax=Glarea lozoyensis (strain ATCC 20868 / MF5171) TaxID=1116229 RepID=S3CC68_GLAL2|nr:uncharacterized protein GLAREA_08017 [Glarea lozoyensis ATCC 20868]EPE24167.1 hypothetical protein GLAREA_08017 [Glarea lozoyensis ATCC 20868]
MARLAPAFFGQRLEDPASLPTYSSPKPYSGPMLADMKLAGTKKLHSSIILEKMKRNVASKRKRNSSSNGEEPGIDSMGESSTTGIRMSEVLEVNTQCSPDLTQQAPLSPTSTVQTYAESSNTKSIGDQERVITSKIPRSIKQQAEKVDTGYDRIIQRGYESYPDGWPRLAAFQNSASSLRMFRRFGNEHCRVLLHLQAEITTIHQKLDELDLADSNSEDMRYRLKRNEWHEGWDCAQKDLLESLRVKLIQYDELLLKDNALRALSPPSDRDYYTLFNWIWKKKPLDLGQWDFALHRNDFVTTSNAKTNGFESAVELCLSRWPELFQVRRALSNWSTCNSDSVQKVSWLKSRSGEASSEGVHVFPMAKIAAAASVLLVCVAVTILMLPVFLLYLITPSVFASLIILVIFVFAFATLMSSAGVRVEVMFIGTCTYSAVLVTFLGNIHDPGKT